MHTEMIWNFIIILYVYGIPIKNIITQHRDEFFAHIITLFDIVNAPNCDSFELHLKRKKNVFVDSFFLNF